MWKRLTLLCLLFTTVSLAASGADGGRVGQRIAALEGVAETKALPAGEFAGKYEVMLTQPLDWRHPERGSFLQRVVVMHVGWDRPTVLITQGYDAKIVRPKK